MNDLAVEELQLLSFFAVEPARADRDDVPWPYNEYAYRAEAGPYTVDFQIAPADKTLSLVVSRLGAELYLLKDMAVQDVRYHRGEGRETLEIRISKRGTLWFRLRPSLFIAQDGGEVSRG